MVGPDPYGRGGMATVARLYLENTGDRARLRFVTTHQDGSVALRLRVWLTGLATVTRLLLTKRVDVLHAHVAERGSVIRKGLLVLLARLTGVPVVLHCHGAEFVESHRALPAPLRMVIAWVFRRASLVVVLGASWKQTYVRLLGLKPANVLAAGNPVPLPAAVPTRPASDTIGVVFLGRFGTRKGSADLLNAVAALPAAQRDRVRLTMAGDGEVRQTRELAASLGLTAEVSDWLTPERRDAALAQAEIFVLPSRDEGLPMAMLESMGWGLVPVITPVGSIPEVITDHENGLLVQPGDVPALTAALAELISDDALRTRLAKSARATVEPFDLAPYLDRMAAEWTRLAATRN
jgi:glycosyltransferase involved in cell wall biosynthesis